jgi:hypothetical protein
MGGYRYGGYRRYGMSKRQVVSIMCGGIDGDILEVFLSVERKTLDKVFSAYDRVYGKSAADYAKRTYKKWRAGIVSPSGQTLERLVDTLPPLLSFGAKCELLRKLRERNRKKEVHRLKVDISNWANAVIPIVSRLVGKAYSAELPEIVEQRLNWLSSGDMQAAKTILVEAEAQEGRNAVALLRQEFQNIDALLPKVSAKASEEAVKIVAEKKRAEQKFENARKDIDRFIEDARMMDQASGVRDYNMSGSFEGASGVTNIQVSRQRSKTATVIAVVVGLILVLWFLSR